MEPVDEIKELKDRVNFLEHQVVELLRGSMYGCDWTVMQRRMTERDMKENKRLRRAARIKAGEDKVLPQLQRMSKLHETKMAPQRIPGTPGKRTK